MAGVLFQTLVSVAMIAWARLGWHYRALVLLAFLFPLPKGKKDGSQYLDCKIWEPTGFLTSRARRATLDIEDNKVSKVWFVEYGLGP